jgi:hypothetical protein
MDGCELDRPTGAWIMNGAAAARHTRAGLCLPLLTEEMDKCDIGKPKGQNKYTCLPVQGIAVKA